MNEYQRPDGSVPTTISMTDEIAKIARGDLQLAANIEWAIARWFAEVSQRPLVNIHRRTLDDTWRQVIHHFGGVDALKLIGLRHDALLACRGDPCVCGRHGNAGVKGLDRG